MKDRSPSPQPSLLDPDKRDALLARLGENLKRVPESMTTDEFEWLLAGSLRGLLHAAAVCGRQPERLRWRRRSAAGSLVTHRKLEAEYDV